MSPHENCDNPELQYRAIKIVHSGGEEPETYILLAGSITEKAQWLGDFTQVGVAYPGHVISMDCHII